MSDLRTAAQQALTYEEFCKAPMQYTLGMTGDWGAQRMYRNNVLGIQKEVVTERTHYGDPYGGWKDGTVAYFMDRDPREFANVAELYEAWMARVCGAFSVSKIGGRDESA